MHVAHDGAAQKHILDCAQVRVLEVVDDRDVVELDVEILVDRLERARDLDVVFEFHRDGVVDEGFEEAVFWFKSANDCFFFLVCVHLFYEPAHPDAVSHDFAPRCPCSVFVDLVR